MKKSISLLVFTLMTSLIIAQTPERFSDEGEEKKENQNVTAPEKTPEKVDATANSSNASSNKKSKSDFADRLRVGGNLSLGFGTYTYINVSPRVHYLVQDNLGVGTGFSYYYWKDNRDIPPNATYVNYKNSGNTWGLNFFSWYNPIGPITLQAEYEPLNFEVTEEVIYNPPTETYTFTYGREWIHAMFLGGGIRQQTGRANVFIMMLYDVLYNTREDYQQFYSSPWQLRMGVGF